jgi:hypothetical protein
MFSFGGTQMTTPDASLVQFLGDAVLALVRLPGAPFATPPAYLDPGTGSLLIQAVIAALVTVPFLLRRRTRDFVRRIRRSAPPPEQGAAPGRPD